MLNFCNLGGSRNIGYFLAQQGYDEFLLGGYEDRQRKASVKPDFIEKCGLAAMESIDCLAYAAPFHVITNRI